MDQDRLSGELHKSCFDALLQCDEFNSYESLRAVFVIEELRAYQDGLPQGRNPQDRVSQTINYLVPRRLSDGRPVFTIFLAELRKRRRPGDVLYDTLSRLINQTEQELNGGKKVKPIEIPFVIVAMTRDQADALKTGTAHDHPAVAPSERTRCEEFKRALQEHGIDIANLPGIYGEDREDWRPHTPDEITIRKIVSEVVELVSVKRSDIGERAITPKFRSSDFFNEDEDTREKAWDDLGRLGCVVIVDAVSMFHPELCHDFLSSRIDSSEQVAMLVLSPVNPCDIPVNEAIEREIRERMKLAFAKFSAHLEKRYEFSAGNLLNLQRWLFSIVPEVADTIQRMKPAYRVRINSQYGPKQGMQRIVIG